MVKRVTLSCSSPFFVLNYVPWWDKRCCHHCLYVLHGCLILLEDINHRAERNFLIRHAMFITESFTKMKMHAHINLVCACLITSNIISIINFYIMIQLQTQNCFFISLKIEFNESVVMLRSRSKRKKYLD